MTDTPKTKDESSVTADEPKGQKSAKKNEREARLAEALRSNLRRRKSQARERRDDS